MPRTTCLLLVLAALACVPAHGETPEAAAPSPGQLADEAEARLRPKDNPLYPPLHTRGKLEARRAHDFIESVGFATHLVSHDQGDGPFRLLFKPALLEIGAGYIRDGGRSPEFLGAVKELGVHGIGYTVNMVPDASRTVEEQIEAEIMPVIDSVVAVEGPNEPDVMDWFANYKGMVWPESIRAYQADLYHAIKHHADERVRRLIVLSPPLAHPHGNAEVLGPVPCDMVSLHMYQGGALPDDQWATKWLPGARQTDPDKPIYITETGYHYQKEGIGQPGISERAGARYVPRLFMDMFNLGVHRTHYYNVSNDRWGDLREDGTLRPSLVAVTNMLRVLRDDADDAATFEPGSLNVSIGGKTRDLRHLLLQKSDGRFYLALWLNRYSYDYEAGKDLYPEPQAVRVKFARPVDVRVFRPLATSQPVETRDAVRSLELEVPDHVLLVEIEAGKKD